MGSTNQCTCISLLMLTNQRKKKKILKLKIYIKKSTFTSAITRHSLFLVPTHLLMIGDRSECMHLYGFQKFSILINNSIFLWPYKCATQCDWSCHHLLISSLLPCTGLGICASTLVKFLQFVTHACSER